MDKTEKNTLIDKRHGETIRIIAAFVIILSHAKFYIPDLHYLKIFSPWGFCGVSLFFFFSGYGTTISYFHKSNYLKGYLKKNFVGIYTPYLVTLLLYTICITGLQITVSREVTFASFCKSLFLIDNYLSFAWFPIVILGYYMVFYLIARFCKSNWIFPILLVVNIIYMIIATFVHLSPFYYQTSICLCLGTWLAIHPMQNSLSQLFCGVLVFSIFFCLPKIIGIGFCAQTLITSVCAMGFILSLYQLSYYYTLGKLTNVIGGISYALYLCQGIAYVICFKWLGVHSQSYVVWLPLTVVLAFLIKTVSKRLSGFLN